jgi:hypothetical protein
MYQFGLVCKPLGSAYNGSSARGGQLKVAPIYDGTVDILSLLISQFTNHEFNTKYNIES